MTMKLFRGARIYTPLATGNRVMSWEKGAILARNGFIEKVGPEEEVLRDLEPAMVEQEVNFGGRCVVPGFVDPHTPVSYTHLDVYKRQERDRSGRVKTHFTDNGACPRCNTSTGIVKS